MTLSITKDEQYTRDIDYLESRFENETLLGAR